MGYPKKPCVIGKDTSVLQCNRAYDKTVDARPNLPGNIIVIHGVNDVGTSFGAVEQGLCQGLDVRLHGIKSGQASLFIPGTYRMPEAKDKDIVEPDPDAVFFKRKMNDNTHSPVIPFYWGFRELKDSAQTVNGQRTDRYGNRLDKDLSKGGGPFGNASNTLPDMWNKGLYAPMDVGGDPVRPLMTAPGRIYMVLAAKRLAALIAMTRDYDKDDVVSIVAHSQGCLISLLAQAFLLDEGARPADTLILTHPPYSLEEGTTMFFDLVEGTQIFGGGQDAAMADQYAAIDARQTFDARLRTLVNIVQGVAAKKCSTPVFAALGDQAKHHGMVGAKWSAAADRDNRGKVYLYFCPEDMTVALDNIKGIGWQGVPDYLSGTALSKTRTVLQNRHGQSTPPPGQELWERENQDRKPLAELGPSFFQRVFTDKIRIDPVSNAPKAVLVGQAPHDFALRVKGEDGREHVAESIRAHRAVSKEAPWPAKQGGQPGKPQADAGKRDGLCTINGEALRVPVAAQLRMAGQIDALTSYTVSNNSITSVKKQGPFEDVDPIDAATAVTSKQGVTGLREELIDDPSPNSRGFPGGNYKELSSEETKKVERIINSKRNIADQGKFKSVRPTYDKGGPKLLVTRYETPNEARKRWQHEVSPKSFHGAIIGNAENHRNVTAYDVAIGGGKASSDPSFYRYLCAVADWRLQKDATAPSRPSIMRWEKFIDIFSIYWDAETTRHKNIIEGSANYYSTGKIPAYVPALATGLPSTVVCETLAGRRTLPTPSARDAKPPVTATNANQKEKKADA
ncbi:effector protein Tle3 domain-containing protein [Janthinobacterium fluminis]|uniref:DUF3274 domain-containing protein n=1 Tax=Janthinobacterium fluminis TaxID=2987524 RepID=A0ABT5JW70_9BURK|nr:DUF3274 domain-containing protein [Janthinobacterium fluminis]MDC8756675.1 DUF3274 domain-containing protein [Janthinobacterium fluminis]